MKIGTDIVKISRIEKSIESESFLSGVYTDEERAYCKSAQSFAGIFAAKEAYLKALVGVSDSDLSISHDGDYAIATVILC